MAFTSKKIRLGDLLVSKAMITDAQLQHALQEQKLSGRKLGQTLVELGFVDEMALLNLVSDQLEIPFVDLTQFRFSAELVHLLPETTARRYRVMVLSEDADGYLLGMSDPTDIFCLDDIQAQLQKPLKPAVVRESDLLDILDIAYTRASEITSLAGELDEELQEQAVDLAEVADDAGDTEAPVVKLLQKIFEEAINARASDIHIEPDETVLRIRNRIDGVLLEHVMNEKRIASALVVRLKLMSGLDISEKRIPQDGRFNLKVSGHNIDVRLSTMPVQFGESVVMRILDHTDGVLPLAQVGMPQAMVDRFRRVIQRPHGLVLVTGPTGSGKTTTLYGALSELNQPENKIITVEDPVEYRLPRISQVQLHERIGLTFASVLRASLRQDPDILLVGEIRDAESAEIALRAAMTGHMVLSTLHTNDAITSAMRLIDIGADGYLVATALKAIVAQRLVRKICASCVQEHTPDANERQLIKVMSEGRDCSSATFKHGSGCPHCHNTGYRGRIGVFEMLEINEAMAEALRNHDIGRFTKAAANTQQFRPLSFCAFDYALEGVTSLDEVMRVSAQVEDEVAVGAEV
ncbi:GspE/PulE family protein [Gilvimarinus sp. SDUM040013]|uniref:GspE/PulE family protein n=1 Tax=Gilvimarinus gilvus TaxID=3058038 RepID=A0ABU4RUA3_9GAMM|nr:GspE/PulE family protein [Gilvimarinus sp. SDUM040013]MDO3388177.1 GspE/PulE family protein [Gilvimarinus sp. SDUM040013]MDX6847727.1 GspE/PulE family protein [Gilvimarinus sp. SDUM040013]